jgi:hypothetical protein
MPVPNGFPVFVDPEFRDGGFVVFRGTVASGVVTKVGGLCTCSDFSTGVASGTLPACQKAIQVGGESNTDNASSTSRHRIKLTAIDASAGTFTVRAIDENNGATENPADGSFYFALLCSW